MIKTMTEIDEGNLPFFLKVSGVVFFFNFNAALTVDVFTTRGCNFVYLCFNETNRGQSHNFKNNIITLLNGLLMQPRESKTVQD